MKYESAGVLAQSSQRHTPLLMREGLGALSELSQGWEAEITLLFWAVHKIGSHRVTSVDVHCSVQISKKP